MSVPPATTANSQLTTSEAMRRWSATSNVRPHVLLLARWPVGVVRVQLSALYSALHAMGFAFTFVGPRDHSLDSLQNSFQGMAGLEFVGAPVENKRCRLWPVVRALLRESRFDLIHSHGTTAAVHASLANLGLGVPHVASLYDPLHVNQFPGWLGRLKHWTLAQALQKADVITITNQAARANLLANLPSLNDNTERIVRVPVGITSERFAQLSGYRHGGLRERLGIDRRATMFGSLGYALTDKEYAILVDSIDLLRWKERTIPFHVIYLGSGDLRSAQQNILRRGLEKHLSLVELSSITRTDLCDFDVQILISGSTASTLLAMEAMAQEIPVIASEFPAMRELRQDTPVRWVRADAAEALAEMLQQAITQPWLAEAQAFAAAARDRFDRRHCVQRMTALFESLVAQTGHKAKAA